MGLGGLGGGTQMLFGGSGGQDIFQKITWVMVGIFLVGSLALSIMKVSERTQFKYATAQSAAPKPLIDTTPSPDLKRQVTMPVGSKPEANS